MSVTIAIPRLGTTPDGARFLRGEGYGPILDTSVDVAGFFCLVERLMYHGGSEHETSDSLRSIHKERTRLLREGAPLPRDINSIYGFGRIEVPYPGLDSLLQSGYGARTSLAPGDLVFGQGVYAGTRFLRRERAERLRTPLPGGRISLISRPLQRLFLAHHPNPPAIIKRRARWARITRALADPALEDTDYLFDGVVLRYAALPAWLGGWYPLLNTRD